MTPMLLDITTILNELVATMQKAKAPVVIFIFLAAILYTGYQVYVGGQDKRSLMNTLIGLIIFAAIVFSADKILAWVESWMR
jgi:hypothetical protein